MRKKLLVFLFAVIMLLGLSSQAFAADDPAYVDYSYDKNTVFLNTSDQNREFAFFDFFYPFDTSLTLTSEFDPLYKYELENKPMVAYSGPDHQEVMMVALSDLAKIYAPYFTIEVDGGNITVTHVFYNKYIASDGGRGSRNPTVQYTQYDYTGAFALGSIAGTVDTDVHETLKTDNTGKDENGLSLSDRLSAKPIASDGAAVEKTLAAAPFEFGGEIYVPVESFMKALGKTVSNDTANSGYISISSIDPTDDQYKDIDSDGDGDVDKNEDDDIYVGITAARADYMDSVLSHDKKTGHFWNAYYVGNADITAANDSYVTANTEVNRILTYNVYIPEDYNPEEASKFTFMLHGSTGNENAGFERANDRYTNVVENAADEYNYIVLSPNGYTRGPQWAKGVGEYSLWTSFDLVKDDYNIDTNEDTATPNTNKVFITGNSAGGAGTINVAAKYPATFKAMAPTAPAGVTTGLFTDTRDDDLIANMPTFMISGTADITIPYGTQLETYNELDTYLNNLTFEAIEQGHHSYAFASAMNPIFDFYERQLSSEPATDVASAYFKAGNDTAVSVSSGGTKTKVSLDNAPIIKDGKLMVAVGDLDKVFGNTMDVYDITAYNTSANNPAEVVSVRYLNTFINLKENSDFLRVGPTYHTGDTGAGTADDSVLSTATYTEDDVVYVPVEELMAKFGFTTANSTVYAAVGTDSADAIKGLDYLFDPGYVDYSFDKNTVYFNNTEAYKNYAFFDFFHPFDTTVKLNSHDALYKYELTNAPYIQDGVMMVALSDLQKIYAPYFELAVSGNDIYVRHLFFDKVVTDKAGTRSPEIQYTKMAYDGLFTVGSANGSVTKTIYTSTKSANSIDIMAKNGDPAKTDYILAASPALVDGEVYVPVQTFLAALGKTMNDAAEDKNGTADNAVGGYIAASSINPVLDATDVYPTALSDSRITYMNGVLNGTIKTGHFWNAYYVGTVPITTSNMSNTTTMTEVNRILTYNVYIPENYDPEVPSKFTYKLHGSTGNENAPFERASDRYPEVVENIADEYNYIVLSPNGWTRGPQWGRGVGEYSMQKSFEMVDEDYNIDHDKMFITGNSLGGAGTLNYGLKHSSDFVALAPVAIAPGRPDAAALLAAKNLPGNEDALDMPVFMTFNNKDITVNYLSLVSWYNSEMVNSEKAAKLNNVSVQVIEEGHHSYGFASNLRAVFDFFERQLDESYVPNDVVAASFKSGRDVSGSKTDSGSFGKIALTDDAVMKDGVMMVSLDSLEDIYGPDFQVYNVSAYNSSSTLAESVIAVKYLNSFINLKLDDTFMRVGPVLLVGDTKGTTNEDIIPDSSFTSNGLTVDTRAFTVAPCEISGKVYVPVAELMQALGKTATESGSYLIISDTAEPSSSDINGVTKAFSTGSSSGGTTTTTPEAAHGTAGHPALRIDGKVVDQTDTNIYIKDGRTMVPVRVITETMGYSVDYKVVDGVGTVTVTKGSTTVVLKIGQTTALVNGVEKKLDTAPEITGSRTYIPIRFLAEAFDYDVDWDGGNYVADIKSK